MRTEGPSNPAGTIDAMTATPRMGDLWNEPADEVARRVATAEEGLA